MASVSVTALKLRLCAIEVEALAALSPAVTCSAYPRWTAKHDGDFPYWINRVLNFRTVEGYDVDYGEELEVYEYIVASRLIVAHVTAEYEGEVSEALDEMLPQVVEYADARELLQSAAYTTPMPYLLRASFAQGTGFSIFPPAPSGTQQVGAEFQWRCQFNKKLTQAYV